MKKILFIFSYITFFSSFLVAEDWPHWGKDHTRNMVSKEKNITTKAGKPVDGKENEFEINGSLNIKWIAKLGSQSYGNVTVSNGKIFVGTNNETPRDPRFKNDHSVIMCFEEKTGKFLWQFIAPKLGSGKVGDWEFLGICSSPAVDGECVYFVSNRCEVVCLDVNGQSNGNQGPFMDEGKYMTGGRGQPLEVTPQDADILWTFDMRLDLGVFPHNITSSSVLVHGDHLWVNTSNGVDWSHTNIPSPQAPVLVCLDKKTGKLLGEEGEGISEKILHGSWSSPALLKVKDVEQYILGGPDGFCYSFGNQFKADDEGYQIMNLHWKVECNLPEYRQKDGVPIKYAKAEGPSEIIATPVVVGNRVYVAIGQDPEHGEGVGNLVALETSENEGKATVKQLWNYAKIHRSISTCSVEGKYLVVGDYSGYIHCLNVETGKPYWVHYTGSHLWGSTLIVDNKIYIGNEDGLLTVLELGDTEKVVSKIYFNGPIYSSPIVANGVLYIQTCEELYAIEETAKKEK